MSGATSDSLTASSLLGMSSQLGGREIPKLLAIYNLYRLLVSALLLAVLWTDLFQWLSTLDDPRGLALSSGSWLASGLLIAPITTRIDRGGDLWPLGILLFDVVVITFIARAGGGLATGLPLLYLVTAAAAPLLLQGRLLATGVAATSVLALLLESSYQFQQGAMASREVLSAGLLGGLIFLISLLLQQIVSRMATFEQLADAATTQVATLEELNQQIIAHMSTGVARVSADGALTPVNRAAQTLLDLQHSQAVAIDAVSPALAKAFNSWSSGQYRKAEPFKRHPESRSLMPEFVQIGHDFEPETLLFVEDYTPVNEAAQTLKLRSLGKLTASIAHEIRNPLTAISHASQLLQEDYAADSEESELFSIIHNNTLRVNEIIENILQLSRRSPPALETLDLLAWLPMFLAEYQQGLGDNDKVLLSADLPACNALVDPGNLRRVLSNLLDNGLRHAEAKSGQREVMLQLLRDPSSQQCCIDVIDDGDGVPDALVDRLFEPFFTTSAQGSGLGLYLCRELCESNGGSLHYGSTAAGQTRFRVTLRSEDAS